MKVYFSILLFVCLAVKPIYTIGYIGYYELNVDYIVEKYCVNKAKPKFECNGKCHLSKKLSLSASVDTGDFSSKAISTTISEAFVPVYYQNNDFKIELLMLDYKRQLDYFVPLVYYNRSLSVSSPPPWC